MQMNQENIRTWEYPIRKILLFVFCNNIYLLQSQLIVQSWFTGNFCCSGISFQSLFIKYIYSELAFNLDLISRGLLFLSVTTGFPWYTIYLYKHVMDSRKIY